MRFLRSNTAVIVTVGPFYDKTDGVTIKGSLTITNEKISLTADTDAGSAPTNILDNVTGATSATANDLNYITGTDAGLMQLELAAADVNRVGRMFLTITDAANHVPVFHEFFVLPQVIYDWLTAGAAPLTPTVAGTTLDCSAGGEAGVDWANVGGKTTVNALTNTSIITTQKVDVETIKTGAVVNGGTVTFPTNATLASTTNITAGTITTATTATNLTNAPTNGDFTATMKTSIGTAVAASAVASVTAGVTVTTNNDKTGYGIGVGGIASTAFAAGAIDAAAIATDAIGSAELAQGAAQEIADEVLDRNLAGGGSGNSRNVRNSLRALRNKVDIAVGTATIYQEDDTSAAWTATITTTAGNPISTVDPA